MRTLLAGCLQALDQLQKTAFAVYADRRYQERRLDYERDLHRSTRRLFHQLHALRSLLECLPAEQQGIYLSLLHQVERMYSLILSLGGLRFQVEDHTTFSVVEEEFRVLSVELSRLLQQLSRRANHKMALFSVESLQTALSALEDVNRSALQVVAGEPIVFLLFIET